jgi:hypothetical protein
MVTGTQLTGVLAAASMGALGCATLLGGLDEGTDPSTSAASSGSDGAASATGPDCGPGWLSPFRYRAPIAITYAGAAIRGYQVKVALPTASLVATGKMSPTGADVRVTKADGITVVPHWTQSGVGTDAAIVWASLDVGEAGPTTAFLYYGNPGAPDSSSLASTFVSAVIDDPTFDRNDAWAAFHAGVDQQPTSRTNEWSVSLAHDSATIRLFREASTDGAWAGICQTAVFPAGSGYRVLLDASIRIADNAHASLSRDGLRGDEIWASAWNATGAQTDVESSTIAAGPHPLCLAVATRDGEVGQGAEMTYSRLRVRRYVKPEPSAVPGAEQQGCR